MIIINPTLYPTGSLTRDWVVHPTTGLLCYETNLVTDFLAARGCLVIDTGSEVGYGVGGQALIDALQGSGVTKDSTLAEFKTAIVSGFIDPSGLEGGAGEQFATLPFSTVAPFAIANTRDWSTLKFYAVPTLCHSWAWQSGVAQKDGNKLALFGGVGGGWATSPMFVGLYWTELSPERLFEGLALKWRDEGVEIASVDLVRTQVQAALAVHSIPWSGRLAMPIVMRKKVIYPSAPVAGPADFVLAADLLAVNQVAGAGGTQGSTDGQGAYTFFDPASLPISVGRLKLTPSRAVTVPLAGRSSDIQFVRARSGWVSHADALAKWPLPNKLGGVELEKIFGKQPFAAFYDPTTLERRNRGADLSIETVASRHLRLSWHETQQPMDSADAMMVTAIDETQALAYARAGGVSMYDTFCPTPRKILRLIIDPLYPKSDGTFAWSTTIGAEILRDFDIV